jgi:hypothetical protein
MGLARRIRSIVSTVPRLLDEGVTCCKRAKQDYDKEGFHKNQSSNNTVSNVFFQISLVEARSLEEEGELMTRRRKLYYVSTSDVQYRQ